MIDLLQIAAFHSAYARAIDGDALEDWPGFFTANCRYRITHVENEAEGLPAGVVWADSRAMLADRVAALRQANIYERQRYRHLLGLPFMLAAGADEHEARRRHRAGHARGLVVAFHHLVCQWRGGLGRRRQACRCGQHQQRGQRQARQAGRARCRGAGRLQEPRRPAAHCPG